MDGNKTYDVFISYRREGGLDFARSIACHLRAEGYRCFFDQRELKTGQFNQQIFEAIEHSRYFLAVLTPGALDRCSNQGDWVREEIEHARQVGIPVVPVAVRDELAFPDALPESLAWLKTTQASFIDRGTDFEDTIGKMLRNQLPGLCERTVAQQRRAWGARHPVAVSLLGLALFSLLALLAVRTLPTASPDATGEEEHGGIGIPAKGTPAAVPQEPPVANAATASRPVAPPGQPEAVPQEKPTRATPPDVAAATPQGEVAKTPRTGQTPAEELSKLRPKLRESAEADFRNSLTHWVRLPEKLDPVAAQIVKDYEKAASEGRKLHKLGMRPKELVDTRPDLVLKFANLRGKVQDEMKQLVKDGKQKEALAYYNSAKRTFEMLGMCPLGRPSFSN